MYYWRHSKQSLSLFLSPFRTHVVRPPYCVQLAYNPRACVGVCVCVLSSARLHRTVTSDTVPFIKKGGHKATSQLDHRTHTLIRAFIHTSTEHNSIVTVTLLTAKMAKGNMLEMSQCVEMNYFR